MATLKLEIENGFFVGTNGCYVSIVEPTHVIANGWDCVIDENGTIRCDATRYYSDGEHSMRYVIQPNGFAKLTLKVPYDKVKTLRKGFVVSKGSKLSDGLLGLAGGYIDERYAYFRDGNFQKFLNKFGITAVKHEDPNQKFSGFSNYSGWGTASQDVFSDGNIEWDYEDAPGSREYFEQPGCNPNLYSGTTYHTVTNATWAIVETRENYRDNHNYARILYTTVRNVMDLEDSLMENSTIAKYVHDKEQTKRLNELEGREVHTLGDVKSVVAEVLAIAPRMKSSIDDEKVEEFLKSFELADGDKFMVEAWGPMPNNSYADYDFSIICGNGKSYYGRKLKIATGFLG